MVDPHSSLGLAGATALRGRSLRTQVAHEQRLRVRMVLPIVVGTLSLTACVSDASTARARADVDSCQAIVAWAHASQLQPTIWATPAPSFGSVSRLFEEAATAYQSADAGRASDVSALIAKAVLSYAKAVAAQPPQINESVASLSTVTQAIAQLRRMESLRCS